MTDLRPTGFIVRSGAQYLCPVCGYDGTFRGDHYDDKGGCAASGICSSCLFEPGFDDNPLASALASRTIATSIKAYRAAWLAEGMPWRGEDTKSKPANWDPGAQLARLFQAAPFL